MCTKNLKLFTKNTQIEKEEIMIHYTLLEYQKNISIYIFKSYVIFV